MSNSVNSPSSCFISCLYRDWETKHLYYDLYKKEPQSKEDFIGFEDKILNRIKTKTNESDRVDRARPTVVNVNNGGGGSSGGKNYEILTGGNVVRKMPEGGTIEVKNAVVVDLKDKGQIMGIKDVLFLLVVRSRFQIVHLMV